MQPSLSLQSIYFAFAVLALAAFAVVRPAAASTDAEAFTQRLVDESVGILRNTGDHTRLAKFRAFITEHSDARKAATFALGNFRRQASEADVAAFTNAFQDYVTAVYETHLDRYRGETLKVIGSIENKPGDVTVNTIVVDKGAAEPLRISFRLLANGGNYHFVDVQVAGIWLSVDQRDQFASFLSQHGGSVPALTAHLSALAQQIRANVAQR